MATADQILSRVLVRCMWPSTNAPLTSAEILSLADDEILGTIFPQLHAAQGDWHLAYEDHELVSGQALYRLPNAAWGPVKDLGFVDASGEFISLPVINVEELGRLTRESTPGGRAPFFAYLDGDAVGLTPVPSSASGSLRIRYYRQPSTLTLVANARQITALPTSTTITLASTISGWTSSTLVDVIGQGGSHQVIAAELGVTSVVSTTLTLDAAYPSNIAVGDWISVSGTTPLAQIPDHTVPQLVQRVAMQCLSAQGDQAGFVRAATMAADLEKRGMPTLDPRNEAEPRVIMPRGGLIRRGR